MPIVYDKVKMRKLFLEHKGNLGSIIIHKDMPKSKRTIKKHAKEGKWYEELAKNDNEFNEFGDIVRLEKIRSKIYELLVSGSLDDHNDIELRPKTYTEAVKCYLEVDSRIDEKRGKSAGLKSKSWEDILRDCIVSNG